MPEPTNSWLIIAIVLALLHWIARWRGLVRLGAATKLPVMLALILWSLSSGGWEGDRLLVGAGLFFSIIGDGMLQLPKRFFIPGLFAFLMAHISYAAWFLSPAPVFHPILAALFILMGMGMYFYYLNLVRAMKKNARRKVFLIPVMLYGVTLGFMALSGCQTLLRGDWPQNSAMYSALGGILFLTSDSLLGYNRFVHPLPGGRTLEMMSYHTAQAVIIAGMLLR